MLIFWLLAGLMLLAALALVLVPILRPGANAGISAYDASVAVHRQRLESLEQQHRDGSLDSADFQQAREELEFALLNEIQDQEHKPGAAAAPRYGKLTAVAILILVPALSLGLYAWLGNYRTLQFIEDPQAMQALMEQHPPRREEVQHMVNNLKLRLRRSPDDIRAWKLLAGAQQALEQYAGAAKAYDHLIRAKGETAELLADYAEAASMANQMQFTALARERLERSLVLAPNYPKSLMLGALAAIQGGDRKLALSRWKTLLAMHEPGSEQARLINMLISHTKQDLSPPAPASPSIDSRTAAASGTARIQVDVSLDPALRDKISGRERVFVFARAVNGPPMPVAVKVLKAADLPASLVLDDSSSMPSGRRLSSVEQVRVGARISFSGQATPSSGDLEGQSETLRTQDNPSLNLIIDRVRP